MDTRLYKVDGAAIQDVEWTIVVEARDEQSAKILAVRGIGTIYNDCRNLRATGVTDVTTEPGALDVAFPVSAEHPFPLEDGQVHVPGVGIRGTGLELDDDAEG